MNDDATSAASSSADLRQHYDRALTARDYRPDAAQSLAIDRLEDLRTRLCAGERAGAAPLARLARRFTRRVRWQEEHGLYLWGEVGRGKTWLMDLFFRSLPFPERRRLHFHRFMHEVHATLAGLRQRVEAPLAVVAERIARRARVLCLDELAVSDIGDAMILGGLFAGLFEHGVTLVTTSNMPPQRLYAGGLQRQRFEPVIELIERHVEVLELAGPVDYRLRELTQAGTYLPAQASDTPRRLVELFTRLAGRADRAGGALEVLGRRIPVVRVGNGAVWFEFAALCGGPRSQEDYIEIAREYACVILSDVPQLDERHENEARRFIALIDELYDRGVNLIVSAAASPQELYHGERLQFEFRRTVSRLIEMQSEEYLAREHRA